MELMLASFENDLLHHPDFIGILAITLGCSVGVIAIVFTSIGAMVKTKAREATKREMAAYVAEGTIDPDKAIAMLNAGESSCSINVGGEKISINNV